jgi:hypothetical protein
MPPHFFHAAHIWALPNVKHETNIIMNLNICKSKRGRRGRDLMPTHRCKIDKSTLLFIGGTFMDIRWPPNFELPICWMTCGLSS